MQKETALSSYANARERYAALGVDTDAALDMLRNIPVSIHCWQADDVTGFERLENLGGGGIQATGNHPGKARNIDELRMDIEKTLSLVAGTHRLNLHEIYGEFGSELIDRDQVEPRHFGGWMQWAKEIGVKLDFNSTSFGHAKSGSLTLANPDKAIRDFWIEHTRRCRRIADEMGRFQNDPCLMNLWIHDGSKDAPVNRQFYRLLLQRSLDEIFAEPLPCMKDCIESKLFGIALESFTVGSHDFYLGYCVRNSKIITLDTGHFHPTESVADKISAILPFVPEIMLHLSRPVRWDSDHVTILNDETAAIAAEIVRADALRTVHAGLDYFDASINRIGAYVVGIQTVQKAFLQALLEPIARLREYEAQGRLYERLAMLEEAKSLPWGAVWDYFRLTNNLPSGEDTIKEIMQYEQQVTSKR
ncbi:MAG: L-rhamnose isomerase [Prevotellaceae bacterium]|jgi:L-rhamnose isomerase|nr:L-rhamnose isomerase [Prevotellaceae bacterium]